MGHWWDGYPLRMIQTNLREIDMEDIDAKSYVKDLKDFGATAVLLNAAGIIASYDTDLEDQPKSAYLHGDDLGTIIDECHGAGIKVFARTDFSRVRHEVYEKHPDWACRTAAGDIVNYNGYVNVCVNSYYQQEYKLKILEEVLSRFPFDGIFFNMSGFMLMDYDGVYYGPCHCENCQRKFREMYGEELPEKDDPRNPVYKKYTAFKARVTAEHKKRMHETIRGVSPEIAINNLDYIRSESGTEVGQDRWVYSASMNARKGSGTLRARLTDNACVDFMDFRYRHTSVSPGWMTLRQWQNVANAGTVSMFIMGRLDNHKDTSVFGPTREIFQFHKEYEALFTSLVSDAKVLLVHKGMLGRNDPEPYGWIRALTESHVPFDEINLKEIASPEQLQGKDVVVLADARMLSDEQAKMFDTFAREGGTVIATGESGMYTQSFAPRQTQALECLGVKGIKEKLSGLMSALFEISDAEKDLFPHCAKTPLIAPYNDVVLVEPDDEAQTYLHLIPEHPFGPPEICYYTEVSEEPGIVVRPYGKGKGIWLPWMIGSFYFKEGFENSLNIMQDVLFSLAGLPDIAPELTPMVELNICRNEESRVLQLVNTTGCFANSCFAPVPVHDIEVFVPGLSQTDHVKTLRGGKAEVREKDGRCYIALDVLRDYEGIVISSK